MSFKLYEPKSEGADWSALSQPSIKEEIEALKRQVRELQVTLEAMENFMPEGGWDDDLFAPDRMIAPLLGRIAQLEAKIGGES